MKMYSKKGKDPLLEEEVFIKISGIRKFFVSGVPAPERWSDYNIINTD